MKPKRCPRCRKRRPHEAGPPTVDVRLKGGQGRQWGPGPEGMVCGWCRARMATDGRAPSGAEGAGER